MRVQPSRWVASAGFLLLVPVAIWLAYLGRDRGLYADNIVPAAFGGIVALGVVGLFVLLPVLRRWERRGDGDDS